MHHSTINYKNEKKELCPIQERIWNLIWKVKKIVVPQEGKLGAIVAKRLVYLTGQGRMVGTTNSEDEVAPAVSNLVLLK